MEQQARGPRWIAQLLHDDGGRSAEARELRALQQAIDEAACDAYGWSYLKLEHDLRCSTTVEERKGRHVEKALWRFTISVRAREEILRRLLKLNHQRFAEEVARGLHEKGSRRRKPQGAEGEVVQRVAESPGLFDGAG